MITNYRGKIAFFATLSLTLSVIATTGCKNKGGDSVVVVKAAEQLPDDPLLKKIPNSTAMFGIQDFGGEGYKLFSKSAYAKTKKAKQSLNDLVEKIRDAGAGEELINISKRIIEAATQLGLVSAEGAYTFEKVIARAAFFVGPVSHGTLPVDAGLFIRGTGGVNLVEKLGILRSSLSSPELQLADESFNNSSKGFSVGFNNVPVKVYFGATNDILGVTLDKANLEALFASNNTGAIDTLRNLPEYKQATKMISAPEKPVSFMFTSLPRFKPTLELIAKSNQTNDVNPAEIPFDGIAIQSSFPKQYVHNLGVAVNAKNESQTKILAALEGSYLSPATLKLPNETALSIALDTKFLSKLEPMIKSIEESAPAGVADQAKKLESLTLGIRNNAAGSPIPDIFLMMESSGREELRSLLESTLGMTMSLVGQNASWQTKDIDGNQAKYFTTLVGAGVYMSAPSGTNNLVIGSSEVALKDLLSAQSGKTVGIASSMPAALKTQVGSANLASFYFNFKKVAEVINSVKSTLAMFTGGNSELNDLLNSADIASWGFAAGGISYAPGTLSINSSFDPGLAS
jgi:hypothetical protein